ncbi:alpha/beta fold hydrolase [Microbacterium yannicii]|uniref:alpha/beta fold hydrolase n=1 Tax=Microbacterium yannicii TaxID=671622 RepID=UPI0002D8A1F5|nr:alpha/beta fold hydrolase [Microbacterium yannicii]
MLDGDQVVRHVRFGDGDIAWSSVGSGPVIVLGGWWSSHLVHDWESPQFRDFVTRLAEHFTVVRYDPPGVGLSRRVGGVSSELALNVRALAAVIEACSTAPVILVAGSSGCPVVVALAADRREVVDRLVLYGGYLRGADVAAPSDRDAIVALVRRNWGISSRILSEIFRPDATGEERRAFAAAQRRSASADEAATALAAVYQFDASEHAGRVAVPTLVLHRRGDRAIRFALGRDLADSIPGARFDALDGVDHFPWYGDADAVTQRILSFLGVDEPPPAIATAAAERPDPLAALSTREIEVLRLVGDGLTDGQIGQRLFLSPHTVHRHVANARTKLGVPTRAAAASLVAAAVAARDSS